MSVHWSEVNSRRVLRRVYFQPTLPSSLKESGLRGSSGDGASFRRSLAPMLSDMGGLVPLSAVATETGAENAWGAAGGRRRPLTGTSLRVLDGVLRARGVLLDVLRGAL